MNITFEDYMEIRNLISTYTIATDNKDVDGFMNCWVEPDEFEGYDSGAFGNLKTWQELRNFEAHHTGPGGDANGKRHFALNIIITPVNSSEVMVTHDMLVAEVDQIPGLIASGRYNNSKVVKTEKGWKFKWRKLDVDQGFFKLVEQWDKSSTSVQ